MASDRLSDKAMAVFAFAAYHQLSSGEMVVDVILENGDLARTEGERAGLATKGKARLAMVIDALEAAA